MFFDKYINLKVKYITTLLDIIKNKIEKDKKLIKYLLRKREELEERKKYKITRYEIY